MANEAATAERFVREVLAECERFGFAGVLFCAVVDDVSRDGTRALLEGLGLPSLRVVYAPENRSVVDAYVRGYREALAWGADWILEIDAGYSHLPHDVPRFLEHAHPPWECVFATRFARGASYQGGIGRRFLVSYLGSWLARLVLRAPLTDMTSGFQLFSRAALCAALATPIRSRGPFFQTEIKARLLGRRIREVPITYVPTGKVARTGVLWDALRGLAHLARAHRRRRGAVRRIQIYGERCSGTNYLEHLLQQNIASASVRWDFGWKHFFPEPGVEAADDCLFVVIHRDPFDWLRSLHAQPWHAAQHLRALPFGEFIRAEWWCIYDEHGGYKPNDPRYGTEVMVERDPATQQRFANVLRLRTAKIRAWQGLRARVRHYVEVRYEDLAADPRAFVAGIAGRFGLRRRWRFRDVEGYKGLPEQKYRRRSYDAIAPDDLAFIRGELDPALEREIGYSLDVAAANAVAKVRTAG